MKPLSYILVSILILFLVSCSEPLGLIAEDVEREAAIQAELEVGQLVVMTLSTTFTESEEPIFPNEEQISIPNRPMLSNITTGEQVTLRNQINSRKWITESFLFGPGESLTLQANLESVGLTQIFATTTVPFPGEITSHSEIAIDSGDTYDFSIELSQPELEDNVYHVKPFLAESANSNDIEYFDFSVNSIGESTMFRPSHLAGILIDIDRTDNMRQFDFSINKSELSSNPSNIYLKVMTVTKEYYDYHRSVSLQTTSSQGPFEEPVPIVSNIERGQGLFSASTVTLDSIRVE